MNGTRASRSAAPGGAPARQHIRTEYRGGGVVAHRRRGCAAGVLVGQALASARARRSHGVVAHRHLVAVCAAPLEADAVGARLQHSLLQVVVRFATALTAQLGHHQVFAARAQRARLCQTESELCKGRRAGFQRCAVCVSLHLSKHLSYRRLSVASFTPNLSSQGRVRPSSPARLSNATAFCPSRPRGGLIMVAKCRRYREPLMMRSRLPAPGAGKQKR